MNRTAHSQCCPYAPVAEARFRHLSEGLGETRARMQRLEAALGRGLMLLIANLAGVVVTLAHLLIGG